MQNFMKNFLIVYGTKSHREEYRSRKFPRLFLRWKARKHGFWLALICIKKKLLISVSWKSDGLWGALRCTPQKCKISDFSFRLSASLVLNCINFTVSKFLIFNYFWKKCVLQKKVYSINFLQSWILYSDIFFFANIPYFNFQINFQSSHLTKKETEDASKRLSSYCMGAFNWGIRVMIKLSKLFNLEN